MPSNKVVLVLDRDKATALAHEGDLPGINDTAAKSEAAREELRAALQQEGQEAVEYRVVGKDQPTIYYRECDLLRARANAAYRIEQGGSNIRIQTRTVTETDWIDLDGEEGATAFDGATPTQPSLSDWIDGAERARVMLEDGPVGEAHAILEGLRQRREVAQAEAEEAADQQTKGKP